MSKEYYRKNRDTISEKKKAIYARDKVAVSARRKVLRADKKNKAAIKARAKVWYAKNKAAFAEYKKQYRLEHKTAISEFNKLYMKAKPEVMQSAQANRRARKLGSPEQHTSADIRKLFDLQRGKCAACKIKITNEAKTKNRFQVDHVVPLVRGGSNGRENLQLLCAKCNRTKHATPPEVWAREHGLLFV
jgi:5-methylcytosine-specific restriction endonuclease McrA